MSFIDVLLRGVGLAGQALALGGVAFVLLVLRAWSIDEALRPLLRRSLGLTALGTTTLALTQTLGAALELRALADGNGWPLRGALDTLYFQVNVVRLAGCTALAAAAVALSRRPSRRRWWALALSAAVVATIFTPQWPRLASPTHAELAGATTLQDRSRPRTAEDVAWSEYNHHMAGLFVLSIGVLALIAPARWGRWARHWPLLLLGLAAFLFVRDDPEAWPLGPIGFWESMGATSRWCSTASSSFSWSRSASSSGWSARSGSRARGGRSSFRCSAPWAARSSSPTPTR